MKEKIEELTHEEVMQNFLARARNELKVHDIGHDYYRATMKEQGVLPNNRQHPLAMADMENRRKAADAKHWIAWLERQLGIEPAPEVLPALESAREGNG